jgi:hypothetical protein
MVVTVLLLAVLVGQGSALSAGTVRVDDQAVTVTAYPRAPRTIATITLHPHVGGKNPAPLSPRSSVALGRNGLQVTFDHPGAAFTVVIRFDDQSFQALDEHGRRMPGGNGPRFVEPARDDRTLVRTSPD